MTDEDVTPLAPVRHQALTGTLILMPDTKSTFLMPGTKSY
jgi:hypothetical protein